MIVGWVERFARPNSAVPGLNSRTLLRSKLFPSINETHCRIYERLGGTSALFRSRLARIALAPNAGLRHFGRRCFLTCFPRLEGFGEKHQTCGGISGRDLWDDLLQMRRKCQS